MSSFLEMSENRYYLFSQPKNSVPFATGSCRKFKPEVEWKAPQGLCLSFCLVSARPLVDTRVSDLCHEYKLCTGLCTVMYFIYSF